MTRGEASGADSTGDTRALRPGEDVAVIVLAGGRSQRFGSDKLAAPLGGHTVLDHLLAGLPSAWPVIAVGPARPTSREVTWVREDPPLGGPLAGVAAGVAHTQADIVVVVAGDMPWAGPVLTHLLAALRDAPSTGAAVALDDEGQANPLLAAYRREALAAALPHPAHGRRAKLLLEVPHVEVPVAGRAGRDVDVPGDLPGTAPAG